MLLFVFLFNVGGYYILFLGLRAQADRRLTLRLDTDGYTPEQTLELKIPVTLPYPLQANGYERIDGRFEHQGQFFKLVKQKLQRDTLYVVCVRDEATRALVETMNDYVQLTQSLPSSDTGQKTLQFISKLIADFYARGSCEITQPFGRETTVNLADVPRDLLYRPIAVLAPPPKI